MIGFYGSYDDTQFVFCVLETRFDLFFIEWRVIDV